VSDVSRLLAPTLPAISPARLQLARMSIFSFMSTGYRHERKERESNRPGGQSADLALVQRIEQLPRRLPFLCQEICRYHLRPERGCHDQWQPDITGVVIAKRFYANSNVSWHYDRALNLLSNLIDFPHLQLRRKYPLELVTARGPCRNRLTRADLLPTFFVSLPSRCSALVFFPILSRPACRRFYNSRRTRAVPSTPCVL